MPNYLPIDDTEIAPEAPGTSILFHRLRDNPEAVFRGDSTAPRIPYVALNTGAGSITMKLNTLYTRPGGAFQIGDEYKNNTTGTFTLALFHNFVAVQARGAYISKSGAVDSTGTCYNRYFKAGAYDNTWMYFLKEISTGDILAVWECLYHPSYGSFNFIYHPFPNFDSSLHEIFVVNLTAAEHEMVQQAQIPLVGGGYLTPAIFGAGGFDIDYYAIKRDFLEAFYATYTLDYTPLTWLTDLFYSTVPLESADIFQVPEIEIPEHADITRIGVNLI